MFCKMLRPVLEPTDRPIEWVPEAVLLEHEGDCSLHSSAKVKNECCHALLASNKTALQST